MDPQAEQRVKAAEEAFWLGQIAARGPAVERALQALMARYDGRFERTLRGGGLSEADAEEVLQDMWIEVERKAGTYTNPAIPPAAWLHGFLRIAVMRGQRKHLAPKREVAHAEPVDDAEDPEDSIAEALFMLPAPHADAHRQLTDLENCVREAFQKLKKVSRIGAELVYRREMQEWELHELALSTGLQANTVKTYLSKARAAFKPLVQPCWDLYDN